MSDLAGVTVLVAGAGLAGLAAARDLTALGAAVTVIDARDRVGGRVLTARDGFAESQHAEAGGDMIDEAHAEIRALAADLGLTLARILRSGFAYVRRDATSRPRIVRPRADQGWDRLSSALEPLTRRYQLAECRWDSPIAADIGQRSVVQWLDEIGAEIPYNNLTAVIITDGVAIEINDFATAYTTPEHYQECIIGVGLYTSDFLCDRYLLDYGDHGTTGEPSAPIRVECRVIRGTPPIAGRLPAPTSRVGIDRAPVDLADPEDVRWLLACVWPDTGRLERTAASIRLAQQERPTMVAGDANEVLPSVLGDLPDGTAAVITTTWAFAYFSVDERRRFVEHLEAASRDRPVAWLSAEASGVVSAFGDAQLPDNDLTRGDVLGLELFDQGSVRHQLLGYVHQHGGWIDWRATSP